MTKYETSHKTRQALIDAAGELAAENGFNAISTRAIAQKAGENIGSIHYQFGSKEKLFEAVLLAACQRWQDQPLEKTLEGCDLQTTAGQAEAIRKAIARVANLLFAKAIPVWYCRVVYQVLQTANSLRGIFVSTVMDQEHEQVGKLLSVIDPSLNEEMQLQHFLLLFTPLFFHADYQGAILQRLGKTEYSQDYLDTLVENCIKQALLRYNLPLDSKS